MSSKEPAIDAGDLRLTIHLFNWGQNQLHIQGYNLEKVVLKTMIRYFQDIKTKDFLRNRTKKNTRQCEREKKKMSRLAMKKYFIALHPVYKFVSLSSLIKVGN